MGFAIGSETWGSIVSPATRCRVTGLRPTLGASAATAPWRSAGAWTSSGRSARSVEDCALVFAAIYGPDGKDHTVVDRPFSWNPELRLSDLRIGYLASAFEQEREQQANDERVLEVLRSLGASLVPIELPDYPIESMAFILFAEAAAAFDELTRSDQDDLLARQVAQAWPNALRQARLIPAVEYIQANRLRTLAMRALDQTLHQVDCYVGFGMPDLLLTNLTGHPAVVVPTGVDRAWRIDKHHLHRAALRRGHDSGGCQGLPGGD